jgi:hypothetical protein
MKTNFQLLDVETSSQRFVRFGPLEPSLGLALMAPEKVTARVSYPSWGCTMEVHCAFLDARLGLERIVLEATNPTQRTINSTLTQNLEISKVMREICLKTFPQSEVWAERSSQDHGPHLNSDEFLAQIYWFENATWGKPRMALMNYMNWSRTNANWHIKRLAKSPLIGMPGIHATDAGDFAGREAKKSERYEKMSTTK